MKDKKRKQLTTFTGLLVVLGVVGLIIGYVLEIDWLWAIVFLGVLLVVFFVGARVIVTTKTKVVSKVEDLSEVLMALGGKENIQAIEKCATRVKLTVLSSQQVSDETIRQAGIVGVIKPSNTSVQLVTKELTESIYEGLREKLDETD